MIDSKKIKIILAILICLFLIGNVIVAILLYNQVKKPKIVLKSETKYADDVKRLQNAVEQKNVNYCDQMTSMKKDDCLYIVGTNNNDLAICNLISDTAQAKKCSEIIASHQIIINQDLQKCLALTIEEAKADCLTEIFRQQNDLNYCTQLENNIKTLCEDIIYTNLAFSAKDQTICDKILSADKKINCQSAIAAIPKDSDNDGVPDYLERAYGTNPFDPQSK